MNSSSGSGAAEPSVRIEGQQRELIIISLATYGDFVHDLLRDERRLNVAITRAKYKLIILGDAAVLKSHPAYYSLFRHCVVVTAADIRKDTRPSCRGPIKEQKP